MSTQPEQQNTTLKFSGSPVNIGAQIWVQLCGPAINAVAQTQTPEALSQTYAGVLSAALGSMTRDFGHAGAAEIADIILQAFIANKDQFSTGQPQ